MLPAHYGEHLRANPDGSLYPGDAFYFLFEFSASSTCMGLSVGPVLAHGGLDVRSHHAATWKDAGPWAPGQPGSRTLDASEPSEHPHSVMTPVLRPLETVHYYWYEGGPLMFSVREDSGLQGWQKRALSGKSYWTQSTWEEGYAASGSSHAHLPPCGPAPAPCEARDALDDPDSRARFAEAVAGACSEVELYSGCVFGKALVGPAPECPPAGKIPSGIECPGAARLELVATGLKKSCGLNDRSVWVCRAVPQERTARLAPDVRHPQLGLELRHERIFDSDGHLARNADGTYYPADPVAVAHEPVLEWKDERSATVVFEVSAESGIPAESRLWCQDGPCDVSLERESSLPVSWSLGHGEGVTVYSTDAVGPVGFDYRADAYNGGVLLGSASASTSARIVPYEPEYSGYAYPVLSDGGRTSYENGVGAALHYFGSREDGVLHEGRRSKVDSFSYRGEARGPWEAAPLLAELEWSGSLGAGQGEHAGVAGRLHPDRVPWEGGEPCEPGDGTLAVLRAGYCRAYFSYPVLSEMVGESGPRREGASLSVELYSADLAGKRTRLLELEYRFSEALFGSDLIVRAHGPDGSVAPVPLTIYVEPDGTALSEYVREKALRDTGDPGLALMVSGDAPPSSYSASGTGEVRADLRRVSSEFPSYGGAKDAGLMGVRELARSYLASSESARLAVPLDVGLGAPSPLRVTVAAGEQSREYAYRPDFAQETLITVNSEQGNPLRAERRDGYVEAEVPAWFGPAVAWYAGGVRQDAHCPRECALQAQGRGSVLVEAENGWGGRASATAPGLPEASGPRAGGDLAALALFALALPIVWWARRRISRA